MSPRIPVVHSVAVYDGQLHLGDIAKLGNGQFAAFDPDGQHLGRFNKRGDAERFLLARRTPEAAT